MSDEADDPIDVITRIIEERYPPSQSQVDADALAADIAAALEMVDRPDPTSVVAAPIGAVLCPQRSPHHPLGFFCTLPADHEGPHVATDTRHRVMATW